jgi:hypothetical protein
VTVYKQLRDEKVKFWASDGLQAAQRRLSEVLSQWRFTSSSETKRWSSEPVTVYKQLRDETVKFWASDGLQAAQRRQGEVLSQWQFTSSSETTRWNSEPVTVYKQLRNVDTATTLPGHWIREPERVSRWPYLKDLIFPNHKTLTYGSKIGESAITGEIRKFVPAHLNISYKYCVSNIKLQAKRSSGRRVDTCRKTDMTRLTGAFHLQNNMVKVFSRYCGWIFEATATLKYTLPEKCINVESTNLRSGHWA